MFQLCSAESESAGRADIATVWALDLLTACDRYLSKVILERDGK